MISFNQIWTVARYEIKTLWRSWFYRIFAGLTLIILVFLNVIFFTDANKEIPWMFRGIPHSIPYFNMLLLNLAQAIIGVFLASDFLKRDYKSDTTQVIYMRSMSNGDYIFGKTLGLLAVFCALDLLLLTLTGIVHLVFSDTPFALFPYIAYFLLIGIPTLFFIFGLSFFIMSLLRNQAVTFIILLGLVGMLLIVMNFKYEAAFDAFAFFLPLAYSDLAGFADFPLILAQRLSFLFLGLGLIFLSILLFKRLPQSRGMFIFSSIAAVVFLIAAPASFFHYFHYANSGADMRQNALRLNDSNLHRKNFRIVSHDLQVEHMKSEIKVSSSMMIQNPHQESMSTLFFSLNPGLIVDRVLFDGISVPHRRELHLIVIMLEKPLPPLGENRVEIEYHGKIDDRICYLQTAAEERKTLHSILLYKPGKKFSFIKPLYILLTPETNWYPIAGVTEGTFLLQGRENQFTRFSLRLRLHEPLTPISQAPFEQKGDTLVCRPNEPLPQLSLIAGPYVKNTITVDSVNYNLYRHPRHDYYLPFVSEVKDTLHAMIRDLRNSYESRLGLSYPYKELSLIETPIHFFTYVMPLRSFGEQVQPTLVLLPENGVGINDADFKAQIFRLTRRTERQNQTISTKEQQISVLRRFFESTFLFNAPLRGPRNANADASSDRLYTVFPNYYNFINVVDGDMDILLSSAIELYLKSKVETSMGEFMRFRSGITDEEKANLLLKNESLAQLLQNPESMNLAYSAVRVKSDYLFRLLQSRIGTEKFNAFIETELARHRFLSWESAEFFEKLQSEFNVPFQTLFTSWYDEAGAPGFRISDMKNYRVFEGDRTRHQIKFIVSNPSAVDGLVVIDFQLRGQGGFRPGPEFFFQFAALSTLYQRIIVVPAESAKQISLLTDEEPGSLSINTVWSQNLPLQSVHRFEEFIENRKAAPIEEERVLAVIPSLVSPGEVVVDNESPQFHILSARQTTPLQRLLKVNQNDREEYQSMRPWNIPEYWCKTINSDYYGDMILSAHFIRAGDGTHKVEWEANLPEAGHYTVFAHIARMPMRGRRGNQDFIKDFHYLVRHDDGEEKVHLDAASAEEWSSLGSFYFSAGPSKVELSNASEGRAVVADAIKWVKQ